MLTSKYKVRSFWLKIKQNSKKKIKMYLKPQKIYLKQVQIHTILNIEGKLGNC